MKPHKKELKPSKEADMENYFESMKEVSFVDSYPEVSRWVQRVERSVSNEAAPVGRFSFPHLLVTGRLRWVTLLCVIVLSVGFIPLKEMDVLGHLIYAQIEGDTASAAAHMEQHDFPLGQAVYVRQPDADKTKLVILLPDYNESDVEPLVGALQSDQYLQGIQVQRVEEEIQRSIYESFFSNLPASLTRSFTRERVDMMRWSTLYRPYVAAWLDTETVSYGIQSSRQDGEIQYRVLPLGIAPLPTEREQLFEEYIQVDQAIGLLGSEHESVREARGLLEAYRDSLDARISGKRE